MTDIRGRDQLSREAMAVLPAEFDLRNMDAATNVESLAVHDSEVEQLTFEEDIQRFLDPNARIDPGEQLELMREFWGILGADMPALDDNQVARLARNIAVYPEGRVIPAPILNVYERKDVAERGRVFERNQFGYADALWTPDGKTRYRQLLNYPQEDVKEKRNRHYGLRYKVPGDEMTDRVTQAGFITRQQDAGHAVEAANGYTWVFPVMDIRVDSRRTSESAGRIFKHIDQTVIPEALITVQLLHQAGGQPNPNFNVDFANEAIYELDYSGRVQSLAQVACVGWDAESRQVFLGIYDTATQSKTGLFGTRSAMSGL